MSSWNWQSNVLDEISSTSDEGTWESTREVDVFTKFI